MAPCSFLGARRSLVLLFVALTVSLSAAILFAPAQLVPLALPCAEADSGGVIEFYDYSLAGDTFVWCLDVSCSMGWNGELVELQSQVSQAIDQLSPDQELGLCAFSSNTVLWSATPLPATQANKDSAIAWVNALNPSGWTCMLAGLLNAVSVANQSTSEHRVIVLFGDGFPVCNGASQANEVLAEIPAANVENIPIHCMYLYSDTDTLLFFEDLAEVSGGMFLPIGTPLPEFRRGDADGDGVVSGLPDGLFVLSYQFITGSPEPPCLDAADADDDGSVSGIVDGLLLLNFQFAGGAPPCFPGPTDCGNDPSADDLDCDAVCP